MIIEEKEIPKDESLNSTYNGTDKWNNSTTVIKLTVQNGGALITDELPGKGIVKQRIAEQEKQIQSNKLPSINNTSNSATITPGSSKIYISSQSSSENAAQQDKLKKSQIPVLSRSNTKASLFSNDSRNESPKIFKFDIKGRLVILSQKHPFLECISSERKKIPLSHRNAYRIDNLTDEELENLNTYLIKPVVLGR